MLTSNIAKKTISSNLFNSQKKKKTGMVVCCHLVMKWLASRTKQSVDNYNFTFLILSAALSSLMNSAKCVGND